MDNIRVGINGFGRIARSVLRLSIINKSINVVCINYPNDIEKMVYLFKYDSVHGTYKGNVTYKNDTLIIDGKIIKILTSKSPKDIKWDSMEVDIVIDSTGIFRTKKELGYHINNGCKKVILTCPPKDDIPIYVLGVNNKDYNEETIISNASCTTNCIGPIIKMIDSKYGIEEGHIISIHSITSNQKTVDKSSNRNLRLGRSSGINIIPTSTGAGICISKIYPPIENKLTAISYRVPTVDVSCVDLTLRLKEGDTIDNIIEYIQNESIVIDVSNEPLVSTDYINNTNSGVIDRLASMSLNNKSIKLVVWYDNEYGYASRVIDMVRYITMKN